MSDNASIPQQEKITREELLYKEFLAMLAWVLILLILGIFFSPRLPHPAQEGFSGESLKAPWIFLALQEGLKIFPPFLWGVVFPLLLMAGWAVLPFFKVSHRVKGVVLFASLALLAVLTIRGFYSL